MQFVNSLWDSAFVRIWLMYIFYLFCSCIALYFRTVLFCSSSSEHMFCWSPFKRHTILVLSLETKHATLFQPQQFLSYFIFLMQPAYVCLTSALYWNNQTDVVFELWLWGVYRQFSKYDMLRLLKMFTNSQSVWTICTYILLSIVSISFCSMGPCVSLIKFMAHSFSSFFLLLILWRKRIFCTHFVRQTRFCDQYCQLYICIPLLFLMAMYSSDHAQKCRYCYIFV